MHDFCVRPDAVFGLFPLGLDFRPRVRGGWRTLACLLVDLLHVGIRTAVGTAQRVRPRNFFILQYLLDLARYMYVRVHAYSTHITYM